jgi:DNA primase
VISPDTIAAVKDRVDIVVVIGETVRLKRQGRRWTGLCPFHKEKTPSFSVNQERGFFHCFGCKESGSAIDFLMKIEGCTFPEAVRALADRCGIPVEESSSQPRSESDRKRRDREDLYAVSQLAAVFFEEQLRRDGHPLALLARAELERRGLSPGSGERVDETLAAFRIGYAPYGWDGLSSFLDKQGVSSALAERLGLIAPRRSGSGHYDAFRHRLMFAVHDRAGRVIAFSGRALDEPPDELLTQHQIASMRRASQEDMRIPKYVNSPESPIYVKSDTVFGLYAARLGLRSRGHALLVEGNFDVVALHARGVDHAVAPLGTAFTQAQARLIKRYAPELVVMFDGDAAGRKATRGLRQPAREAGLTVRVASLPAGTDPDSLARDRGVEAIESLIKGARGMLEYLVDETLGREAVWDGSRQQTLERVREVLGYLAEESDPNLRSMAKTYADEVASRLVVGGRAPSDLRALERMVEKALGGGDEGEVRAAPTAGPWSRSRPQVDGIALSMLGAVLDYPELLDDFEVERALSELSGEAALGASAMRRMWDGKKSLETAELLDLIPQAIHPFAVGRLACPLFSDSREARMELLENAEKLRRRSLTGDKAVKVRELTVAQQQGDVSTEDELLRELDRVARKKRRLNS